MPIMNVGKVHLQNSEIEKARGVGIIKLEVIEFLRLVHVSSERG